jgi:deoxycytidine triphosphate deaminase
MLAYSKLKAAIRTIVRDVQESSLEGIATTFDMTLDNVFKVRKDDVIDFEYNDKWVYNFTNTEWVKTIDDRIVVPPGGFLLAQTREEISVPWDNACVIEGLSTLGRCGISVHQTANHIQPGFSGHVTLEIKNLNPSATAILIAGMRIAQLSVYQLECDITNDLHEPKVSQYQNQKEPIPGDIFKLYPEDAQ